MSESMAGRFVIGEGVPQEPTHPPVYWPFRSEADLHAYIERIVRKVLEDDARAIREHAAFQPVTAKLASISRNVAERNEE